MTITRETNCAGCRRCCTNDAIILHPEHGDVASKYLTEPYVHPFTGKPVLMLAKKPGTTECIYLGPDGCKIHGRAPAICREFDCGLFLQHFMKRPRAERRRMVRDGMVGQDVLDQGARVNAERGT